MTSGTDEDVTAPILIKAADAQYPESLLKQPGKFSGACVVAMVVDTAGVPRNVHIAHSLGEAFDGSAIKAVEEYRFKPGMHAGKPVPVSLSVEVNFRKY